MVTYVEREKGETSWERVKGEKKLRGIPVHLAKI